jgi:hypothetical protein
MLSTINISPKYQFTSENSLIEVAKQLIVMGIDTYKFSLVPSSINLTIPNTIKTVTQLISMDPYLTVFNMPELKNYVLWAYTINSPVVKDGMSPIEIINEYNQIYELTVYLLTKYSNTGKTFYLGNWETDWGTLGFSTYTSADPSQIRIQGAIDYFNIRQKAIDDAKAATIFNNVMVYHYAEVVMVKETVNNPVGFNKRCLNAVIPYVPNLDFISWSAYTLQDDTKENVSKWLDVVKSYLPTNKSSVIPGNRIFIGEFGWKNYNGNPVNIVTNVSKFTSSVFSWGCQFAFYWQMYTYGPYQPGFCLIDNKNNKTPLYYFICKK